MTAEWDDLSSLFRHKSDLLINLHKPANDNSPFSVTHESTNDQNVTMNRFLENWWPFRDSKYCDNCCLYEYVVEIYIWRHCVDLFDVYILIRLLLYLCLKCHSKAFESLPHLTIHNTIWNHWRLMPHVPNWWSLHIHEQPFTYLSVRPYW